MTLGPDCFCGGLVRKSSLLTSRRFLVEPTDHELGDSVLAVCAAARDAERLKSRLTAPGGTPPSGGRR